MKSCRRRWLFSPQGQRRYDLETYFRRCPKGSLPITQLCHVLGIARSWFYGFESSRPGRHQRQKRGTDRDAELLPKIKLAFSQSKKRYGSKRIHQNLKADGEVVSKRRVARTLRENKI
ncbi:MAG: IS3 family transposase [Pseudomonadota bacterium]